jgi:hypothetical protein
MKRNHTIYSFYSVVQEKSTPGKIPGRKREKGSSPCESAIRNLLSYSKALSVLKTRDAGILNLVMN